MGHKSNPIGLRLQINRTWDSRWFAEGEGYRTLLEEDLKMRKFIIETLPQAAISKVVIERPAKLCRVSIYAARPGVIIGKKGSRLREIGQTARAQIEPLVGSPVYLAIQVKVAKEWQRDPKLLGRLGF